MTALTAKPVEITWSLMHPTPLDPEYMRQILPHTRRYRMDSFELCGECHTPYGGLDGLIDYAEFPHAAASWNQETVQENRRRLNEIVRLAHSEGKAVYYWHRDVMLPPGLLQDMPDLLDENGEFDLTGDSFARLIDYKVSLAIQAVPELDGVVLTLTEADYSAIHNSDTQKYPPVKVVAFVIEHFARALGRLGKRFIMRSFGSIAKDYEDILAGAKSLAGKLSFEVETKITPYDFDPFLPVNPWLKHTPGFQLGAECDCLGEFLGRGFLPLEHVHKIVEHVHAAQKAGVARFAIRMDRCGHRIFDLYEINYYAYSRAIECPDITAEQVRQEWQEAHYPASERETLAKLDQMSWELVTRTMFLDHHVLFHGNYCMKYLHAAFVFALFQEGASLKNGREVWSILTDRAAPGCARLIAEKEEAVEMARTGLALLRSLNRKPDWREQLWENACTFTQAILGLVKCIAAYVHDMSASDQPRQLPAMVQETHELLESLAGHPLQPATKVRFVNGLEHRTGEDRQSVESVLLFPLDTICHQLLTLFQAEEKARHDFLANVTDGMVCGGIMDDGRILRYMHGSHCAILNGYPARWAGNRVFPNGFMEFKMKRADELALFGAPEEAPSFAVTLDGTRQVCQWDANGQASLPLPPGDSPVLIRLEKVGRAYPAFYAVATRAKG